MGKSLKSTIFGTPGGEVKGYTSPYNRQQLDLLNQVVAQAGPMLASSDITKMPGYQTAQKSLMSLAGYRPEEIKEQYQQQFVNPAMQTFTQDIIPAIQQKYANVGATRSSALNQSLAQAGENLGTQLSSQLAGLLDAAKQRQLAAAPALAQVSSMPFSQALSLLSPAMAQSQTPIISQGKQGILGSALGAIGGGLGSYFGGGGTLGNLLGLGRTQKPSAETTPGADTDITPAPTYTLEGLQNMMAGLSSGFPQINPQAFGSSLAPGLATSPLLQMMARLYGYNQ